jgi:hypothetical protein
MVLNFTPWATRLCVPGPFAKLQALGAEFLHAQRNAGRYPG